VREAARGLGDIRTDFDFTQPPRSPVILPRIIVCSTCIKGTPDPYLHPGKEPVLCIPASDPKNKAQVVKPDTGNRKKDRANDECADGP
jgi:hypothetical protein